MDFDVQESSLTPSRGHGSPFTTAEPVLEQSTLKVQVHLQYAQ